MADEKMQELNRDEIELLGNDFLDDDLLADIPSSLLDTSPVAWEEEPTPVIEEHTVEEEFLADDLLAVEDLLLTDEDLIIEELLAEYHSEPKLDNGEMMNNKKAPAKKAPVKVKKEKSEKSPKQNDRLSIILMGIASFLSLGIIAMLIYWLEVFLK